ncbi:MAG: nuclear transport factor 2 family protein [Terriglobales bacterium]
MKRSIWVVAVLVLLASSVVTRMYAQSDAAAVKALEEKWAAAASKNDDAAVASLLADSVTSIGSDGVMRNKSDMMAAMKNRKYESAVEDDIKVQVFGDAAVTTGIWRAKGTDGGKPFSETERFTDTYIKMGGQWKCVASHSSPMK